MSKKPTIADILSGLQGLGANLASLSQRIEAVEARATTPTPQRTPAPPLPARQGTGQWPVTPGARPMAQGTVRVTPQGNVPLRTLPEQVRHATPQVTILGQRQTTAQALQGSTLTGPQPAGPRFQRGYSREEQGTDRMHKCAACGQQERMGTVVIATGEYLASGITSEYLRALPAVAVHILNEATGQVTAQSVSGAYLAKALNDRPKRNDGRQNRAISVPGFLCGEPNAAHPTISLVEPLLRRASREEESVMVIARIGSWLASLNVQDVIQSAHGAGPSAAAKLMGAAQDMLTFADNVTKPFTH